VLFEKDLKGLFLISGFFGTIVLSVE